VHGKIPDVCGGGGMSMSVRIEIPKERLAEFCRRNHIRRLAFFGSVLRDDFTPESDVDVLVEFEPGTHVGLRFFGMELELSEILRRKVDLNTRGFLNKHFRDEVIAEAEVLYDAA
jgi:predicted nucleotidyltransferase